MCTKRLFDEEHDKKEIENLQRLKKEYFEIKNLSKEERINRFLKAMRGELC